MGSCTTALGCTEDVAFESCEDFGGSWSEDAMCPGSCTTSLGCTDDVSWDSCEDFGGSWATAPCPPASDDDDDTDGETDDETETPVDCSSVDPEVCEDFDACTKISGFPIDIDDDCMTSLDAEDVDDDLLRLLVELLVD